MGAREYLTAVAGTATRLGAGRGAAAAREAVVEVTVLETGRPADCGSDRSKGVMRDILQSEPVRRSD